MKYRNPRIPEGINTSADHPLKEFALLVSGALALFVVAAWLVGEFGGGLARMLPFEREAALVPEAALPGDAGAGLQDYLDTLAGRLAGSMDMPGEMAISVHVGGGDTVNAMATLGGHVLLFRGLLEKLPNENALAMLLAHEMAHVKHRDPVVAIGRGAGIALVAGLLFGDPDLAAVGEVGIYTQLHFSRDMERAADAAALAAVQALYGHVAGAGDLFDVIREQRDHAGRHETPAILSSHPLDRERLRAIDAMARVQGWSRTAATTPLPAAYADWMQETARRAAAGLD